MHALRRTYVYVMLLQVQRDWSRQLCNVYVTYATDETDLVRNSPGAVVYKQSLYRQ